MSWKPTATIAALKTRAKIIKTIREFFESREVLEVETPLLSNGTVTDVHLDPFVTEFEHSSKSNESTSLYLQTSPEFAMKRLLAAGSGPIFQISKAFRNEALGRYHNPEFTMLEWYRPDYDDHQLMDEVADLVQTVLPIDRVKRVSYQQVFIQQLNIDPLTASLESLKHVALNYHDDEWIKAETDVDTLLQWLFSTQIEPTLGLEQDGNNVPCFVYDFPASQASLAKLNNANPAVAHRFELYFEGVELANGFFELQDHKEQLQRFEQDNHKREQLNKPSRPIDQYFIAALKKGLPQCSGVALGIDRLIMCAMQASHIDDVISFNTDNA